MTAPNTTRSGVGFRHCQIFALTVDGYPASVDATAYEGVQISGVKRLTINDPEPQQITHFGDDRIFAIDSLPATEPVTGELVVGKANDAVDVILTGQKSVAVGEAKFFGVGTNKRGNEAQVGMLAYRQTLDTTPGAQQLRRWESRLIPVCLLIPRENSLDENPEERMYTLRPQVAAKYPWGEAFTEADEGFTEAQLLRGVTVYKPKIIAFLGDASTTAFNLPTAFPAASTDKMKVWEIDENASPHTITDVTGTVTLAVGSVTFGVAPAATDRIVVFYEYA